MTAYRRNFVPGGRFFFIVNLSEQSLALLTDHIDVSRGAFRETLQRHPFTIDAIMVLPDHLHTVWTLPEGDADFAMRWQLIKSTISRALARKKKDIPKLLGQGVNAASGSVDIGSAQFATTPISRGMSTTFISIRSSTGSSTESAARRLLVSTALRVSATKVGD